MRKKLMIGVLVLLSAFMIAAAGCGPKQEEKERVLRELPADVAYEVRTSEHTVTYTDSAQKEITLFGELHRPNKSGKFPAVILSHGFNGHYSDFPNECKRFTERGYVCYAFDYCGASSGCRSTGRSKTEYTPFTMKEDLIAVINDIKKNSHVDSSQIFLFGGSQGGFITALTAADEQVKDEIAAIAMYFPAFNIPDDWRGKPEEDVDFGGHPVNANYIRSVQNLDPFAVIGNYKGKFDKDVCIIWGTQDNMVARKYIDGAVATYGESRVDLTILDGAGHGFTPEYLPTAIEKTLSFLEARTYEYK